jgi:hypothetical protein
MAPPLSLSLAGCHRTAQGDLISSDSHRSIPPTLPDSMPMSSGEVMKSSKIDLERAVEQPFQF